MIRLCHTHEWVMSCVWVSHVTHEWVMSHRWMRHTHMFHISSVHVTHTDGSCHSYKWVISRVWLCDVVHVNWSRRHTHEWGTLTCSINDEVMSHTWMRHAYMFYKWWGHVTHITGSCRIYHESCHAYEGVMCCIWIRHVTHMIAAYLQVPWTIRSRHTYEWITSHV